MSIRSIRRYELHEVAGVGGFATVYRATDPRLDAQVAVKVLAENWSHDPEVRSRFRNEAVLLRRVQAEGLVPGMVEVFDIDESDDGRPFIVMGWADRGTLLERTNGEAWTPHDVVPVVNNLADTLVALHRANVVHRDLKPSNLLLRTDRHAPTSTSGLVQSGERLLVGDLGLAKDLDSDVSGISLVGGTESYMAPEQTNPNLPVDHRTDVFGASAVVRRLLTGGGDSSLLPDSIRAVLARGTAVNPDDRQQSIDEWRHEVLQAFGPTAPSPRPAPAPAADQPAAPQPPTAIPTPSVAAGASTTPVADAVEKPVAPAPATPEPARVQAAEPPSNLAASTTSPSSATGAAQTMPVDADTKTKNKRSMLRPVFALLVLIAALGIGTAVTVLRDDPPEIIGPRTIEVGETVRFRSAAPASASVSWTDWNGTLFVGQDLEVTPVLPGSLTFTLRVDGVSNVHTVPVTESTRGPRIVGPTEVPLGITAVFTANVRDDDAAFRWVTADGLEQQGGDTFELTPSELGPTTLSLIALGNDGRERGTQLAIEIVR